MSEIETTHCSSDDITAAGSAGGSAAQEMAPGTAAAVGVMGRDPAQAVWDQGRGQG